MNKMKIMKNIAFSIFLGLAIFTSCEDFLDVPPATGLSDDKLVDIPAMKALVYGAFDASRSLVTQSALYGTAMARDVLIRNRAEYDQFYDHQISESMTGWMFGQAYNVLGLLNTVAVTDMTGMEGTDTEKNAILGDMHFLRALVNFDLNNYFALPSTGYSIPLVFEPVGVNDRVSCNQTSVVMETIETDIELARTYFSETSGVASYGAATALAARIYFYHKKYDLAFERANEVITSSTYALEPDVASAFVPGASSRENIFNFKYSAGDGQGTSPTERIYTAYRASASQGFYYLNPDGEAAQVVLTDTSDSRYKAFYSESGVITYIDGKYTTDQMDYIYIRLAEIYLTRAEANIMVNNAVSQQDVDDINMLRKRANPDSELASIPTVEEALDILFEDRIKELGFETADHYLNLRRLEKGIVRTPEEGEGKKPYSEYADLLVFPFPVNEAKIHDLNRNP